MRCVVVSGLSGAGRSLALRQFEDMGYFCVDNMPPQLLPEFIGMLIDEEGIEKAAVVVDTRAGVFFDNIYSAIEGMKNMGVHCDVLYLDTDDDVLIRRYKETRRKHPLYAENIAEGIKRERVLMEGIRDIANYTIDTSALSPRQFSDMIYELFLSDHSAELLPVIVSFGFKNGIPIDADLVFDVRFLPNPYYDVELRPYNGLSQKIQDFVFSHQQTVDFMDKLFDMLQYLLPYYHKEGKHQLVIALGCTGGMHRSVATAEDLKRRFEEIGISTVIQHRDIDKDLYLKKD